MSERFPDWGPDRFTAGSGPAYRIDPDTQMATMINHGPTEWRACEGEGCTNRIKPEEVCARGAFGNRGGMLCATCMSKRSLAWRKRKSERP